MLDRTISSQIKDDLQSSNKIIVIYGARQVGKTTLVRQLLKDLPYKSLEVNADQIQFQDVLSSRDLRKMQELIGDHNLLFIDEAQNIPDIGINLKILHDHLPELRIIATGSSSFELANRIQEPLTGRAWTYHLHPISLQELSLVHSPFELKQHIEEYMLYGTYPEVLELQGAANKIRRLKELTSSYLYKDILQLSSIRHADKIVRLLKLLAYQTGAPVSMHELSKSLGLNHDTVQNYIDLLEKGFILFWHIPFSGNPRKEISKMNKVFFYDTGIRNALIDNFQPPEYRLDKGALWENFLLVERLKKHGYERWYGRTYYWRTYNGVELDAVEIRDDHMEGFEFKWKSKHQKPPTSWQEMYPNADYQVIHSENFLDYIL